MDKIWYVTYDFTYMCNLKSNKNLWLSKGKEREEGETNKEYGIKRYKLVCVKYISNKDISYSTGIISIIL